MDVYPPFGLQLLSFLPRCMRSTCPWVETTRWELQVPFPRIQTMESPKEEWSGVALFEQVQKILEANKYVHACSQERGTTVDTCRRS